jgi:hypothetical protein
MAVALGDPTVLVVDTQFSFLIAADFTRLIDGVAFGAVMAAGTLPATTLHVPASVRVGDDMVRVWTFAHFPISVVILTKRIKCSVNRTHYLTFDFRKSRC